MHAQCVCVLGLHKHTGEVSRLPLEVGPLQRMHLQLLLDHIACFVMRSGMTGATSSNKNKNKTNMTKQKHNKTKTKNNQMVKNNNNNK